mgnify:CR=1 FL=1
MKRFLLSAALLLACSGVALAQESEFSGGGVTAGAVTGTGTAGRVPQFVSASSLEDSKMRATVGPAGPSTGRGVWTLYDDTATVGETRLIIRMGAGQPIYGTVLDIQDSAGTSMTGGYGLARYGTPGIDVTASTFASSAFDFVLSTGGLGMKSTYTLGWYDASTLGTRDTTLQRDAAGVLAQREGTTAQTFRVYKTYTDASNYERLSIGYNSGFGSWDITPQYAGTGAAQHLVVTANGGNLYLTGGDVKFGGTYNWIVRGVNGTLEPGNWDNTADLGSPNNRIQDAYIASSIQGTNSVTLTAATDDPFVEIAVPVGGTVGGYVEYTIVADDATDYQSRSGILPFTVVNKGGTESAAIGTPGAATEAFAESAGGSTLTNTFTTDNATGSNNVRIRANVVSSLTETTLAIKCRVVITSGTATLTFNP